MILYVFCPWCRLPALQKTHTNKQYNRCTDTSDPRHFGTGGEMSNGHFGTTLKIRDQCRSVVDISAPLTLRTQSVTLIYLFKKDYFIDD